MNLVEYDQIHKKFSLLQQKIDKISSVTDEEKEILLLITEILQLSMRLINDLWESTEL